jgi:hypothetical protein
MVSKTIFLKLGNPSNTNINISEHDYTLLFANIAPILGQSDYFAARELSKEINSIFYFYLKFFEGLNKKNIDNVISLENNLQTLDGMVKNKTTKIIFLLSYNLLYHFYLCNMKKRLKDLIFY